MSWFGRSAGWVLVVVAISGLESRFGLAPAWAQHTHQVLSQREAAQYGLYRAWYGHFSRAGQHDQIAGVVLYVPPAPAPDSQPEPQAEGEQQQDAQAANAAEKNAAKSKAPATSRPPLMLYVYTKHGRLHAVEAETGRLHWSLQVGDRRFRCETPAVSGRWIAVIHGLQLILFDRETGERKWKRKLQHTSAVGPAIARDWILVPSLGGRITGFHAEDPSRRWYAVADSQIFTPPAATSNRFVWCTIRGNVYVGRYESGKFPFMVPTQAFVAARPTVWGSTVYVPTQGGFVYAIDTRNGVLQWRHTSADPIYEPVVATGDSVFVVHLLGACHCLERLTGRPRWSATGIKKILAVSRRRVYALGREGKVVVLDRNSGARVGTLPWYPGDLLLTNLQTDRIYVGTRDGFLLCVRELEQEAPLIHRRATPQKSPSGSTPSDTGEKKEEPKDAFDF